MVCYTRGFLKAAGPAFGTRGVLRRRPVSAAASPSLRRIRTVSRRLLARIRFAGGQDKCDLIAELFNFLAANISTLRENEVQLRTYVQVALMYKGFERQATARFLDLA